MLKFKDHISVLFTKEIQNIIQSCVWCISQFGVDCVITSGNDGQHMENSLHYYNKAIDIRLTWKPDFNSYIIDKLKDRLGKEYDVILEKDHLHIEYDSKNIPLKV